MTRVFLILALLAPASCKKSSSSPPSLEDRIEASEAEAEECLASAADFGACKECCDGVALMQADGCHCGVMRRCPDGDENKEACGECCQTLNAGPANAYHLDATDGCICTNIYAD
jgi:hypothetical protein